MVASFQALTSYLLQAGFFNPYLYVRFFLVDIHERQGGNY